MLGRFRSIGRSTLGDASLSKGCALPLYHRLRFPPISPLVIFLFLPPTAAVTYRIISLLRRSARPPPGDVQPGCAPSDPYPPLGIREKRVGSDPIQISITFFTFFSSNALSRNPYHITYTQTCFLFVISSRSRLLFQFYVQSRPEYRDHDFSSSSFLESRY